MSNPKALFDCTFSWGKTCRLYRDSIEIAGRSYNLDDLTYIQPTYRNLFGVPSARLELCFGLRRLTLRGIPDLEIVRQMVSHLLPYAEQAGPETLSHRARFRTTQARDLARAQAKAWERTNKIPSLSNTLQPSATPTPELPETTSVAQPASPSESAHAFDDFPDFSEQPTSHVPTNSLHISSEFAEQTPEDASEQTTAPVPTNALSLPEQPTSPIPADAPSSSASLAAHTSTDPLPAHELPTAHTSTDPLSAPELAADEPSVESPPRLLPGAKLRPMHIPRLQPPLRSVQLVNPEQKALDSCSVPVPALKSSVLPIIHVPVRLQPGECAHYSIGAALCSDRLAGSERAPYPPLDHGLLILTNRRIFYLGKRSQLILAYTHLWYVSLLHNAIALHIEGQFRRIIMEIEHPQEWASRIEQLAFIARRSRPSSEQPPAALVLPGLKPSSALPITVKRAALKLPTIQKEAVPEATNRPEPDAKIEQSVTETQMSEQTGPHIVEANTIEFELQAGPHIVEANTIEFKLQAGPHIVEANTIEFELQTGPHIVEDVITHELAPIAELEAIKAASFTSRPRSDYAAMKTITLHTRKTQEDVDTRILSLEEQDEEVTSKLTAISTSHKTGQEDVDTRILSLEEQDEDATGKLTAISARDQARLEDKKPDILSLHAQTDAESEDEITVPLRRRKIAVISTHPLRPKSGQPEAGREMKRQRAPQSRVLSRPRFLRAES